MPKSHIKTTFEKNAFSSFLHHLYLYLCHVLFLSALSSTIPQGITTAHRKEWNADAFCATCNCNDSLAPLWTDALLVKVDDSVCCAAWMEKINANANPFWVSGTRRLALLFIEMDFRWCSVWEWGPTMCFCICTRAGSSKNRTHTHPGEREWERKNVMCFCVSRKSRVAEAQVESTWSAATIFTLGSRSSTYQSLTAQNNCG